MNSWKYLIPTLGGFGVIAAVLFKYFPFKKQEIIVKEKETPKSPQTPTKTKSKDLLEQLNYFIELMNLRECDEFDKLEKILLEKKDLISLTFLGENFFRSNKREQGTHVISGIISNKNPITSDDIFAVGRAHQLQGDKDKAVEFYKKAIELDNVFAIHTLGVYYQNGIQVEKNEDKARELFKKGAKMGDPISYFFLGMMIFEMLESKHKTISLDNIQKDKRHEDNALIEKAYSYVKKSHELGYLKATEELGEKELVKNNYKGAMSYFQIASDKGHMKSMHRLGLINVTEEINQKETGFKLINESAKRGYIEAQIDLSEFYIQGVGVQKDEKKGYDILEQLLLVTKDKRALFHKARCLLFGWGVEKDEKKALDFMKQSADLNFPDAMFLLAQTKFENEENEEGIELIIKAAELGYGPALHCLQKFSEVSQD